MKLITESEGAHGKSSSPDQRHEWSCARCIWSPCGAGSDPLRTSRWYHWQQRSPSQRAWWSETLGYLPQPAPSRSWRSSPCQGSPHWSHQKWGFRWSWSQRTLCQKWHREVWHWESSKCSTPCSVTQSSQLASTASDLSSKAHRMSKGCYRC